ncbi:hypothetical protein [Streptomyces sp. NPDC002855]|uniref:hypothetical protein n=1 Tax=unclassified Streptomyces TaxID=2593676 RepID=UPI003319AB63
MHADSRNGLVTQSNPESSPRVTRADPAAGPTSVILSDCRDSARWLQYRMKSGELAADQPQGRQAITAEVKKQNSGEWKVTRFALEGTGSC